MRRASLLMTSLVLAALVLAACGGQATSTSLPSTSVPPATVAETSTTEATSAPTEAMTTTPNVPVTGGFNPSRVSNLIGSSVCGTAGDQLGTVKDLVLDFDQSMVTYAIVSDTSGKTVAVPWTSMTMPTAGGTGTGAGATSAPTEAATSAPTSAPTSASTEAATSAATSAPTEAATAAPTSSSGTGTGTNTAGCLTLTASNDMFTNAPTFDQTTLPAKGQSASGWDAAIQSYWQGGGTSGTGSTSTPSSGGTGATAVPTTTSSASSGTGTGTTTGTGSQQLQGVMMATDLINATVTIGGMSTGTSATSAPTEAATSAPTSAATSAPTEAATAAPTSSSGTGTGTGTGSTGTIQDLIIEPNTGMMQYVVVQAGTSTNWTPVPISFLSWDATNNTLTLNVDPSVLSSAPSFTSDQFPDTSTSGWDQQFSTFWSTQSSGSGTGTGTGTGSATETPTP